VLDLDVSGGARVEEIAEQLASAGDSSADAQQVRLVRLVGLDLEADPLGTTRRLAAELRDRGLVAGAPTPGRTLRELLGLPETPFDLDPARRADRARLTREESA
jgi:hypothetical protein